MQVLDLSTGIDFGARGNLKEFSPVGFSPDPDAVSTWSEASVAELTFRLPPVRHDLRFAIEAFPYLGEGRVAQQECWVFLNGLFVHLQTMRLPADIIFAVSRELVSPHANRLSFALPNAVSPRELRLGADMRLLGLAFVKLSVTDAAAPPPKPAGQIAAPDRLEAARPQPLRTRRPPA